MRADIRERLIQGRGDGQTAQSWFDDAVRYDQLAETAGPFDPAFEHLVTRRNYCLETAAALENIQ